MAVCTDALRLEMPTCKSSLITGRLQKCSQTRSNLNFKTKLQYNYMYYLTITVSFIAQSVNLNLYISCAIQLIYPSLCNWQALRTIKLLKCYPHKNTLAEFNNSDYNIQLLKNKRQLLFLTKLDLTVLWRNANHLPKWRTWTSEVVLVKASFSLFPT